MKKVISTLVLSVCLMCSAFVGCGGNGAKNVYDFETNINHSLLYAFSTEDSAPRAVNDAKAIKEFLQMLDNCEWAEKDSSSEVAALAVYYSNNKFFDIDKDGVLAFKKDGAKVVYIAKKGFSAETFNKFKDAKTALSQEDSRGVELFANFIGRWQ